MKLLFVRIFCLGFIVIGVLLTRGSILDLLEEDHRKSWPKTGGVITASKKVTKKDAEGRTMYGVDITYAYKLNGFTYTSNRVTGSDGYSSDAGWAEGLVSAYPSKQEISVFYDPEDVTSAILQPGVTRMSWVPLILGLAFVAGGIGAYIQVSRRVVLAESPVKAGV